jgi:hypothetical protein
MPQVPPPILQAAEAAGLGAPLREYSNGTIPSQSAGPGTQYGQNQGQESAFAGFPYAGFGSRYVQQGQQAAPPQENKPSSSLRTIGIAVGVLVVLLVLAAIWFTVPFPFNLVVLFIVIVFLVIILITVLIISRFTKGLFGGNRAGGSFGGFGPGSGLMMGAFSKMSGVDVEGIANRTFGTPGSSGQPNIFEQYTNAATGQDSPEFRIWGCPNGLVYLQGQQVSAVRWQDIAEVWHKVAMANGILSVVGYRIQPVNAQPFTFYLLTGPYAHSLDAFEKGMISKISTRSGTISSYNGFMQITGMADLSAYSGLGNLIEEQMLAQRLPQLIESYQQGNAITFGQLHVQQQGLSDNEKSLDWHEIADLQLSAATIQITKKPANLLWFSLSAATIPNVALLIGLLNTIRSEQR